MKTDFFERKIFVKKQIRVVERGYSLAEAMVALAITALITAGGLSLLNSMGGRKRHSDQAMQLDELRWSVRAQFDCASSLGVDLSSDLTKLPCSESVYDLKSAAGRVIGGANTPLGQIKLRGFCNKSRFLIQYAKKSTHTQTEDWLNLFGEKVSFCGDFVTFDKFRDYGATENPCQAPYPVFSGLSDRTPLCCRQAGGVRAASRGSMTFVRQVTGSACAAHEFVKLAYATCTSAVKKIRNQPKIAVNMVSRLPWVNVSPGLALPSIGAEKIRHGLRGITHDHKFAAASGITAALAFYFSGRSYEDNVTVTIEGFLRSQSGLRASSVTSGVYAADCFDHDWGVDGNQDIVSRPERVGMISVTSAVCCPIVPHRP